MKHRYPNRPRRFQIIPPIGCSAATRIRRCTTAVNTVNDATSRGKTRADDQLGAMLAWTPSLIVMGIMFWPRQKQEDQ